MTRLFSRLLRWLRSWKKVEGLHEDTGWMDWRVKEPEDYLN